VTNAPAGPARRPAGSLHLAKRGDDRDGGTSGNATDRRMGVRQSARRRGARGFPPAPTTAHEHVAGHRQPGDTWAQEAARPGSQGPTTVQGTWGSAGDAGRSRRTLAGQAGTTPAGPGTPSPVPMPRRLERSATQARAYPAMACTTLAHHRDGARRADACQRLTPRRAPGVDRGTWRTSKEPLATTLETVHEQRVHDPYGPQPVGRRLLPTRQGTRRPLGLPALEDTIVAPAVARLREAIDAQDVCDAS
jgi:hypothetical protein